jgi:hypothetical protein
LIIERIALDMAEENFKEMIQYLKVETIVKTDE